MKDILWSIFEFAINIYEGTIISLYVFLLLKTNLRTQKNRIKLVIVTSFYVATVTIINHLMYYEGWIIFIYITVVFLLTKLLLKRGLFKTLIASSSAFLCITAVSTLVTRSVSVITKMPLELIYQQSGFYRFIVIILVQAMDTYLFLLIAKITESKNLKFSIREWLLIVTLLVLSIFIMILIRYASIKSNITPISAKLLLVADIALVFTNIIVLKITYNLNIYNQTVIENEVLKNQLTYQSKYADNIKSQRMEMRKAEHNLKHSLYTIDILLKEKNYQQASEYIMDYIQNVETQSSNVLTENEFVNAILNIKLSYAKGLNIKCFCTCLSDFNGIDNVDICNLFGNMLDNAIEACSKVENAERRMEIRVVEIHFGIIIKVKNSIQDSVLNENPKLRTSKNDKEYHGYGVMTIKNIAEKYNGFTDFYEEYGYFYCMVQLFRNSSD